MSPPQLLRRRARVLPLLLALLALSLGRSVAQEEEDAKTVEVGEEEAAAPSDLDSAGELGEKLAQLQELLKQRGGDGDMAELQAKLAGLQEQLGDLGLGSGAAGGGQETELREFINNCMMFALKKVGAGRSTVSVFQKIAEPGSSVADVVDSEFVKLSSVCILEATSEEYKLFKEGKLQRLPDRMVERAHSEDIKDVIIQGMDAQLWGIVKSLAEGGVEAMKGQLPDSGLPMAWGILALVPVLGAVLFLASKFQAMQKEKATKKEKKAAKKQK